MRIKGLGFIPKNPETQIKDLGAEMSELGNRNRAD